MRYTLSALLTIIMILSVVPAYSHRGDNVNIRIISDSGGEFLTIPFKDNWEGTTHVIKNYLQAKRGENYRIVVKNNSGERIGLVIAVDGRNIINGEKSFLRNSERMYIIRPFSTTELDGWRTNLDSVHRFYFTDEDDSYTVRTFGDSSAMGVIAVAVFREKKRQRVFHDDQKSEEEASRAPSAPSAEAKLKDSSGKRAGTGFGKEKFSPAMRVEFESEEVPFKKLLVKYEWRNVLCTKGILKCEKEKNRLWDNDDFAPYPPGYSGR
ncbi:hypothetical protein EP227_08020 [bacterium]|nr:MAG: hypothetical protein EP227_08020 [bacterium]